MGKAQYQTARYKAFRVYLRENWVSCIYCGQRATTPDHTVPVALGGGDDDLFPSCRRCNYSRGGQLSGALRRARARNRVELTGSRAW